jgi:hypothetical protein
MYPPLAIASLLSPTPQQRREWEKRQVGVILRLIQYILNHVAPDFDGVREVGFVRDVLGHGHHLESLSLSSDVILPLLGDYEIAEFSLKLNMDERLLIFSKTFNGAEGEKRRRPEQI